MVVFAQSTSAVTSGRESDRIICARSDFPHPIRFCFSKESSDSVSVRMQPARYQFSTLRLGCVLPRMAQIILCKTRPNLIWFWLTVSCFGPVDLGMFTGQWDEDGVVISRASSITTCNWLSVEKVTWMLTSAGTNTKKLCHTLLLLVKAFAFKWPQYHSRREQPQIFRLFSRFHAVVSQILGTNKNIAPGLNKGIKTVLIWSLCSSDGNTVSWHRL